MPIHPSVGNRLIAMPHFPPFSVHNSAPSTVSRKMTKLSGRTPTYILYASVAHASVSFLDAPFAVGKLERLTTTRSVFASGIGRGGAVIEVYHA